MTIDPASINIAAAEMLPAFQRHVAGIPYERKGILYSEMFFLYLCAQASRPSRIVESGRARGQSTLVLSTIFPDLDVVSIESDADSPDVQVARARQRIDAVRRRNPDPSRRSAKRGRRPHRRAERLSRSAPGPAAARDRESDAGFHSRLRTRNRGARFSRRPSSWPVVQRFNSVRAHSTGARRSLLGRYTSGSPLRRRAPAARIRIRSRVYSVRPHGTL